MATVDTYYSIRDTDRRVHHNNNNCTEGKAIDSYVRSSGSENRPLCEECEQLTATEPLVAEEDRPGFVASFISALRQATGWRPPAGS